MDTYKKYRKILAKHQNIKMLSPMQIYNFCRAMADLEKEVSNKKFSLSGVSGQLPLTCNCNEEDKVYCEYAEQCEKERSGNLR